MSIRPLVLDAFAHLHGLVEVVGYGKARRPSGDAAEVEIQMFLARRSIPPPELKFFRVRGQEHAPLIQVHAETGGRRHVTPGNRPARNSPPPPLLGFRGSTNCCAAVGRFPATNQHAAIGAAAERVGPHRR